MTTAAYFRVRQRIISRQNRLLRAYRQRSQLLGAGRGFILNTEELATIYHFPNEEVRSPQLKRAAARSVEPPSSLPVESIFSPAEEAPVVSFEESQASILESEPLEEKVEKPKVVLEGQPRRASSPIVTLEKAGVQRKPALNQGGGPPENLPID